MGLMEEEHRSSIQTFNDSSATSFMNQIRSVIDQQFTPPDSHRASPPVREDVRQHPHTKPPLDYLLPSRQRADHLVDTYWRLVYTLYPLVDKTDVLSTYRKLWTGEDIGADGPTFICLLNIIFSIACILDPTIRPEERESSADVFYQRARKLLDLELMQRQSTLTVQCLLLLGQYLQSTNDPQQCWIFVGLAIRIAQSIGLDLPSISARAPDVQQKDLLRRVWHGCVLMDRALSMTFGRPTVITQQAATAVPWPMAHDDNSECTCFKEMCAFGNPSSEMHFFIESLKLYELMSETLLTLYNPASRDEPDDDPYAVYFGSLGAKAAGTLLEMDRKLWLWSRVLPIHLRCNRDEKRSTIHKRQANVLWLRYQYVQILLFRPILSRFCSQQDNIDTSLEHSMASKMAFQCSITCVKIALEVIEFFNSMMEGKQKEELDDLLPAWWYSIFYIYTAAAVLVAARLHDSIIAEITEQVITHAWRDLMNSLGHFQNFSKHAKRCSAALIVLDDQVTQQYRQQQRQQVPTQNLDYMELQHQNQAVALQIGLTNGGGVSSFGTQRQGESENMALAEVGGDRNHLLNGSCGMSDSWNMTTDYATNPPLFNTSDLQLDLSDMSWLNSIPLDLYGN